jgi:hypothetical protein
MISPVKPLFRQQRMSLVINNEGNFALSPFERPGFAQHGDVQIMKQLGAYQITGGIDELPRTAAFLLPLILHRGCKWISGTEGEPATLLWLTKAVLSQF